MAIISTPESSIGYLNAVQGAMGLFGDTNKTLGIVDNSNPQPIEEYESSLSDEKIIELIAQWKLNYQTYYDPIRKTQEISFDYWIGKQRIEGVNQLSSALTSSENLVDNLIFEAVETFLPIATRANPEPLVNADPSDIGQQMAKDIKVSLVNWADTTKLRRKLARMTRHWALYRIGVCKMIWDVKTKTIKLYVINPKNMIFDKDGYVDEGGHYIGEYLGEKKKCTAERLAEMFPNKKDIIKLKAQGKMGTKLEYIEWWYCGTDVFFTIDSEVLGKFKNPNWNYDGTVKEIDPETGAEVESEVQGTNHLKERVAPYLFLSVFNTGLQPHDETSLVIQNISLQDMINRRYRQIDKNVEGMNNGMVVSGTSFTEEQASQAASALRRGVAVRVPNGDVREAVMRFPSPDLPSDVFRQLEDGRQELRNIFGTAGSNAESLEQQKSVRGKILVNQMDSSRIGGGVTEYIEQVADSIYNLVVQFMFVYYDEEHFVTTAGAVDGMELVALKNDRFPLLKTLTISVKEGSLVPKDPLTQRNEAIDLWSANAIDPLSLYKKLDFPNPTEATQQLILWQMLQKGAIPPQAYLPIFQMGPQQMPFQTEGVGGPAINDVNGPNTGELSEPPGSPGAVQAESKQLLGAVPL